MHLASGATGTPEASWGWSVTDLIATSIVAMEELASIAVMTFTGFATEGAVDHTVHHILYATRLRHPASVHRLGACGYSHRRSTLLNQGMTT
ncbi:hypothetical protein Save01_06631 [Streptomyces avermitilis]|uniref:Uncharacterized protein n=1 Tax=Streptomyces avermitilis TaxID=33903 RepID=A0A4D4M901_STRAX|nr:hypothetical protein SAV14893_077110 [Streptomyces avermitilis]GDY71319.1 hypothetical protein SAV31267_008040 [Streptomyces avermitilis]